MTKQEHIQEAMETLKGMSCGGMGEDGYTLAELDAYVAEHGNPIEGNSDYHTAQWAWRVLELALKA